MTEIKTVLYVPLSHPFVEPLIRTIRREYLDRTLFWTTVDLDARLNQRDGPRWAAHDDFEVGAAVHAGIREAPETVCPPGRWLQADG